ncbi:rRNA maturation RNase YbeY [Thermodesulfovibrio sp. 3907-1M]|uniref:Endoribonuclease YbeY n=1 Tax=Thermodesulfovibrio autotrophicus TaxID=3118333 RepID=A0AAU8GY63_9BACT
MRVIVEVINRQRKFRVSTKKLKQSTQKVLKFLYENKNKNLLKIVGKNSASLTVSIVVVGNRKMKELNFKYRGKNSTTDVLSFPYLVKEPSDSLFLGEIIVDPEKVSSQAKQYSVKFSQELERILVHGILHLIGYDHERSAYEARRMRKLEEKILIYLQS